MRFPRLKSCNEIVLIQQSFQGKKTHFQLYFFYNKPLSSLIIHWSFHLNFQREAPTLLPEQILSMLIPASADFDWIFPGLHSVRCTWQDFVHHRRLTEKYLLNKPAKHGHASNWYINLQYRIRPRQHLLTHMPRSPYNSTPKAGSGELTSSRELSLPFPTGSRNYYLVRENHNLCHIIFCFTQI